MSHHHYDYRSSRSSIEPRPPIVEKEYSTTTRTTIEPRPPLNRNTFTYSTGPIRDGNHVVTETTEWTPHGRVTKVTEKVSTAGGDRRPWSSSPIAPETKFFDRQQLERQMERDLDRERQKFFDQEPGAGQRSDYSSSNKSYQRSNSGNVSIKETAPDGKYIVLENTHGKEENIGGWVLKRRVDFNKSNISYTIPVGTVLAPYARLKIWAYGQGGVHNPPAELVFNGADSWGTGADVETLLTNKEGEEKAREVQRS